MKPERIMKSLATVVALGLAGAVFAQSETIDVTLEVLDDVSQIDAVVMRLEEARERDEDRERVRDEEREREELQRSARDAGAEREQRERDVAVERDARRELQNEEQDLAVEFERDRAREADLNEAGNRGDEAR